MADIFAGTEKPKLYIGDEEIGGGKSRDFVGYLDAWRNTFEVKNTQDWLVRATSFEIKICIYWETGAIIGASNDRKFMFGTAYDNYYANPSMELWCDSSGVGEVWSGITTDTGTWTNTDLNNITLNNGLNYFKMSYDKTTGLATISYSTDDVTYQTITTMDIGSGTVVNGIYPFGLANNGNNGSRYFPSVAKCHMVLPECRVVSSNGLFWGYLEE